MKISPRWSSNRVTFASRVTRNLPFHTYFGKTSFKFLLKNWTDNRCKSLVWRSIGSLGKNGRSTYVSKGQIYKLDRKSIKNSTRSKEVIVYSIHRTLFEEVKNNLLTTDIKERWRERVLDLTFNWVIGEISPFVRWPFLPRVIPLSVDLETY